MSIKDKISHFLTHMDESASRAMWVAFVLFSVAGVVLSLGMYFFHVDAGAISKTFGMVRGQIWAPFVVLLVFAVLAFIGAPQVVLIAATFAVFGPEEGAILSWVATMVSAAIGFILGRWGGAGAVQKLMGGRGDRALNIIGDNGFIAALIIRLVPSGPFVLVNLGLGAAGARPLSFFLGTALGTMPKILLVGFGAHGLRNGLSGHLGLALLFLGLGAAIWAGMAFIIQPMIAKRRVTTKLPAKYPS